MKKQDLQIGKHYAYSRRMPQSEPPGRAVTDRVELVEIDGSRQERRWIGVQHHVQTVRGLVVRIIERGPGLFPSAGAMYESPAPWKVGDEYVIETARQLYGGWDDYLQAIAAAEEEKALDRAAEREEQKRQDALVKSFQSIIPEHAEEIGYYRHLTFDAEAAEALLAYIQTLREAVRAQAATIAEQAEQITATASWGDVEFSVEEQEEL